LGQKKVTYVYRLLDKGSMEEKIYFRQVNKQAMVQRFVRFTSISSSHLLIVFFRVIDAQQLAPPFTESELREIYSFKPEEYEPQEYLSEPTPVDLILKECLKLNPTDVQNILEHDSLLEIHVEDEFDPRMKEEKQNALLQEQGALLKLYNDKKKSLKAPNEPKIVKRPKKVDSVSTSFVSNPYQFMPVALNPFDLPPNMQKRPD
jgi:hypothetical protein